MKLLLSLFLCCCCSIGLATTPANTPSTTLKPTPPQWYHVGIIVFTHPDATAINSEQWPLVMPPSTAPLGFMPASATANNDLSTPTTTSPASLSNSTQALPSVINTNQPQFVDNTTLKTSYNRLSRHPNYQVLVHLGWNQTFSDQPTQVHLYGGQSYANLSATPPLMDQTESQPYANNSPWELDGSISILVNRYFNIHTNLYLALPQSIMQTLVDSDHQYLANPTFTYFHMTAQRRTRSHELNYLDSPLLGCIMEITKISPPESTTISAHAT